MLERGDTLKSLRENNREMKIILASLRIPRINVLILEKALTSRFEDVVSEIEIILLPYPLNKFSLEFILPEPRRSSFYTTRMNPLTMKRSN